MARFDYNKVSPEKQREYLDQLAEILTTFKTKEEVRFFLGRLLTDSEVVMLTRRLHIAELLISGLTYEQIERKLKVGKSTILGVDRWLTDAAYEYQLIREHQREAAKLIAQGEKQKNRTSRESTLPGTLQHLIRHDSRFILLRLLTGDF